MLDTYDTLLVRECKSKRPSIRKLRKIWKIRCLTPYSINEDKSDSIIANWLLTIILENELVRADLMPSFIMSDMAPSQQFRFNDLGLEGDSHTNCVLRACVSKIRLTEAKKFGEFHVGLRWRLKQAA